MGVSKNSGPPKCMVYFMENPMNKWMIWGNTIIFGGPPMYNFKTSNIRILESDSSGNPRISVWNFGPKFQTKNWPPFFFEKKQLGPSSKLCDGFPPFLGVLKIIFVGLNLMFLFFFHMVFVMFKWGKNEPRKPRDMSQMWTFPH